MYMGTVVIGLLGILIAETVSKTVAQL